MKHQLSEVWVKASIAGTIWAAAEIVLGSFLHNLKVPFTGNLLTAIGMVILISFGYVWRDRGLFWRAGLVCALMKSMSPSAVIFGPMIAIFAESLILEFFTRITARSMAGYLLGAMVAMSWNLFQKIVNYIIFYGEDIIGVYTNLLTMAQKQFRIETDIVWLPIFILLGINLVFGLVSGLVGIRAGRRLQERKLTAQPTAMKNPVEEFKPGSSHPFNYSLVWLAADFLMIAGSFLLLAHTPPLVWITAITATTLLWTVRYKRAFRRLSKPKFWIFFIFITLLTAFVFTRAGTGSYTLGEALMTGIKMNFRAVVIITGFTVLGTELYNPVVRAFFMRTSARSLPLALELSAESLPFFIANMPDLKSMVRQPSAVLRQFMLHAEERLGEFRSGNRRKVIVVTGGVGEGKTTLVKELVAVLKEKGIQAGGIITERIMEEGRTIGYDLVDIATGTRKGFLRENGACGPEQIGRFTICGEALALGNGILRQLSENGGHWSGNASSPTGNASSPTGNASSPAGNASKLAGSATPLAEKEGPVVIVDEVGRLELKGRGWAESLDLLLSLPGKPVILTVRDHFLEEVKQRWNLHAAEVVHAGSGTDLYTCLSPLQLSVHAR